MEARSNGYPPTAMMTGQSTAMLPSYDASATWN